MKSSFNLLHCDTEIIFPTHGSSGKHTCESPSSVVMLTNVPVTKGVANQVPTTNQCATKMEEERTYGVLEPNTYDETHIYSPIGVVKATNGTGNTPHEYSSIHI